MDIIYRDAIDILLLQWEWFVTLSDSEPTGYSISKVLLFWGAIVFFSFYAVFGIRSARGMMAGFAISISGAFLLMVMLAMVTIEIKDKVDALDEQISALEKSKESTTMSVIDLASSKKNLRELKSEKGQYSRRIDGLGLLMNFVIMTLGGFGAGVLGAAALGSSSQSAPKSVTLSRRTYCGYLYYFSFVALCSFAFGVVCICCVFYFQNGLSYWYIKPALGFISVFVLAALGYVASFVSWRSGAGFVASLFLGCVSFFIFLSSFGLVFRDFGWCSVLGVLPLFLYRGVRAAIFDAKSRLLRVLRFS